MEKWFVYILKLKDGKYYIWSTNNLERRTQQHMNGKALATKYMKPIELLYYKEYTTVHEARSVEYHLKKQKDRNQIEKFMQWI